MEPAADRAPPPAHEPSTSSGDAKPPPSEQQPPQYDPGNVRGTSTLCDSNATHP